MSAEDETELTESSVLQAFGLIDAQIAQGSPVSAQLRSLRRRLIGELVGDATLVAPELADDFVVHSWTGGSRKTIDRAAVLGSVERQGESGAVMWVELEELVADGAAIAARGVLRTAQTTAADVSIATVPVALFISFGSDTMTAESLYMEPAGAQVRTIPRAILPSREQLLVALGASSRER